MPSKNIASKVKESKGKHNKENYSGAGKDPGKDNGFHGEEGEDYDYRITSYNVCYTKLLRG